MAGEHTLYWGDSHTNIHSQHVDDLDVTVRYAREMLDFWPIAYYPQETVQRPDYFNGMPVEDWLPQPELDRQWKRICDIASENNVPGTFVAFPGYEWQGDGTWGDHNVFYLQDHQPILKCATIAELYAEIRRRDLRAFAIPHHTAYMPGIRSKNWSVQDDGLSPFAEIYSCHGCSESDEEGIGLRHNRHMGPGVSGGTIEDALAQGRRIGIICSNDSHNGFAGVHGFGLMGCYARDLSRESLWEAFAARRVYGVTGDRIALEFTANGAPMGAEIQAAGSVRCQARVRGCDAVDRIELLRNNRVIATHCHNGAWDLPRNSETVRCKLRVEAGWGPDRQLVRNYGPRRWQGQIDIPQGRVVSAEKCWTCPGQRVDAAGASSCAFDFTTPQMGIAGRLPNQANIFELEGKPSDAVVLTIEGKRVEMTLEEAMSQSRIIHFMDEAERYIRENFDIDPGALPRRDRIYYTGHKVKLHRAVPDAGLNAALAFEDTHPPDGVNHYRVRVTQRNGQMAWSSPVWVENR